MLLLATVSIGVYYLAFVSLQSHNSTQTGNVIQLDSNTTNKLREIATVAVKGLGILCFGGIISCIVTVSCVWYDGKC